jgi:hypothetical protein
MKSIPEVRNIFILFLFVTFILGIFFCISSDPIGYFDIEKYKEQFTDASLVSDSLNPILPKKDNIKDPKDLSGQYPCPNVLLRRGNRLLLFNTYLPESEMNPLPFQNLDEYLNYIEIQRNKGYRCPVLYLQEENDAQGKDIYRIRPSPFSLEGGLPPEMPNPRPIMDATRDNPPFNQNLYNGFDPYNQDIGVYTDLDKIHDSTRQTPISDNPMDTNWGGVTHSQEMIDLGKYAENTVGKPTMVPRVIQIT